MVPVRAVGVRALLEFPDDIHFPASPVKVSGLSSGSVHSISITLIFPLHVSTFCCLASFVPHVQYASTKTILVRNVGDKEAQFTLQTKRCVSYIFGVSYGVFHSFCTQSLFCDSNLSQSGGGTLHASHCQIPPLNCWRFLWRSYCSLRHWYILHIQ